MTTGLDEKHCVPCEGGVPAMSHEEVNRYLTEIGSSWTFKDELVGKITRTFAFKNFVQAMEFVNKVAQIAEAQGHHPDIHISWNKVRLELFTHAIHGLSENDFIVAAKINKLFD